MEHMRRINDDPNNDEIGGLIKEAQDPLLRAVLVVLQNINLSLIANTKTVNEIDDQLRVHLTEYRASTEASLAERSERKGSWKIVSWLLGIMQTIGLWFIVQAYSELQSLHNIDHSIESRVIVLEQRNK